MPKTLQPDGWAKPDGYANGVSARGRVISVAGQIGWNKDSTFETDDFVGQVQPSLQNDRRRSPATTRAPSISFR